MQLKLQSEEHTVVITRATIAIEPTFCCKARSDLAFLFCGAKMEANMATYIALVNFTDQGVRHIRQTTERAKALINAAANLGVKIKNIYWTLGAFRRGLYR